MRLGVDDKGGGHSPQEEMRSLVVHSDRLAARFDAALPGRPARASDALGSGQKRAASRRFACEADAPEEVDRIVESAALRRNAATRTAEVRTPRRARQGRPGGGEAAPTETVWSLALAPEPAQAAMAARGAGVDHPIRCRPDQKCATELAQDWSGGIQVAFGKSPGHRLAADCAGAVPRGARHPRAARGRARPPRPTATKGAAGRRMIRGLPDQVPGIPGRRPRRPRRASA